MRLCCVYAVDICCVTDVLKSVSQVRDFTKSCSFPGLFGCAAGGKRVIKLSHICILSIIYTVYTIYVPRFHRGVLTPGRAVLLFFGGAKDAGYSEPLSAHQLLYPAEGGTRRLLLALLSMLPPDGVRRRETPHVVKNRRSPVGGVTEVLRFSAARDLNYSRCLLCGFELGAYRSTTVAFAGHSSSPAVQRLACWLNHPPRFWSYSCTVPYISMIFKTWRDGLLHRASCPLPTLESVFFVFLPANFVAQAPPAPPADHASEVETPLLSAGAAKGQPGDLLSGDLPEDETTSPGMERNGTDASLPEGSDEQGSGEALGATGAVDASAPGEVGDGDGDADEALSRQGPGKSQETRDVEGGGGALTGEQTASPGESDADEHGEEEEKHQTCDDSVHEELRPDESHDDDRARQSEEPVRCLIEGEGEGEDGGLVGVAASGDGGQGAQGSLHEGQESTGGNDEGASPASDSGSGGLEETACGIGAGPEFPLSGGGGDEEEEGEGEGEEANVFGGGYEQPEPVADRGADVEIETNVPRESGEGTHDRDTEDDEVFREEEQAAATATVTGGEEDVAAAPRGEDTIGSEEISPSVAEKEGEGSAGEGGLGLDELAGGQDRGEGIEEGVSGTSGPREGSTGEKEDVVASVAENEGSGSCASEDGQGDLEGESGAAIETCQEPGVGEGGEGVEASDTTDMGLPLNHGQASMGTGGVATAAAAAALVGEAVGEDEGVAGEGGGVAVGDVAQETAGEDSGETDVVFLQVCSVVGCLLLVPS